MELAITILLAASSAIAFTYGVVKLFRPKVAMFKQLVVCSIGCMMLGRLYNLLFIVVGKDLSPVFNVGMLGVTGGFMFLFSASFGQMDGLVDNRSKELAKYRIISLVAPVFMAVVYVYIFFKLDIVFEKAFLSTGYIVLGLSSYYSLKHVIIPDVEYGIIDSIRSYSALALALAVCYAVQIVADKLSITILRIIVAILISILYIIIIPVMERGSKKWTI